MPSVSGRKNLFSDLLRLNSAISSDDFNVEQLVPLLTVVLNNEPDEVIWDHVYNAVTEHTPPPRSLPFLGQTPYLHNTSSFVNSSEHRKYVDAVLKEELGSLFVGVPDFYKAFFGDIENLEEAGIAVKKETVPYTVTRRAGVTGQNMRPKMKSYSGSQVKSICSVTWLKNRVLPQTLIEGSGRGLISHFKDLRPNAS